MAKDPPNPNPNLNGSRDEEAGAADPPAAAPAPPPSSPSPSSLLQIEFDNASDPASTVVSIEGENKADLLLSVTGAFNALEVNVLDAMIKTTAAGRVLDVFRVTDTAGGQLPEARWGLVREHLLAVCSQSNSRSARPAIYGVAAELEVEKLRPLIADLDTDTNKLERAAAQLELAAAEMARAAAELVRLERGLTEARKAAVLEGGAEAGAAPAAEPAEVDELVAQEAKRAEAAAVLERHMSAMEALLAGRRNAEGESMEGPSAARGGGADLRFAQGGGTGSGPAAGRGNEIFFQGFNWDSHKQDWYKELQRQVEDLYQTGFTAVWLPPPTDSVSPQGYLPRDLYSLDSCYGSEAELRELVEAMHAKGLKAVADIVINHRCAHNQDDQGRWNKFGGRLAWDASYISNGSREFGGTGGNPTGEDYEAAPNIDHTQERVRNDLSKWLKFLRNSIGFDGWRFDYVKGYSGEFTREYIDNSVPQLAFGEFWDACEYTDGVLDYNQDKHRQRTVDWCDSTGGTSAAFDFTTKGILQEALAKNERWRLVDAQGRPPGVLGLWPSRAVSFIENHDTGSSLQHWPFPSNNLMEGYAYILTHPGTPCVFYDHYHQSGLREKIKELMAVRKGAGLDARAEIKILIAKSELYAACIGGRVAMKIGPGNWSPNDAGLAPGGWQLATSGVNYAVWRLPD